MYLSMDKEAYEKELEEEIRELVIETVDWDKATELYNKIRENRLKRESKEKRENVV